MSPGLGTFSNLPLEVRQQIYTHALRLPLSLSPTTSLGYTLLRTSSIIYAEALPFKFSSNPILIAITPGKWDNLLGRRPFGYTRHITIDHPLVPTSFWSNPSREVLKYMRWIRMRITTCNERDSARYVPRFDSWARRREGDEILQVVKDIVKLLEECWRIRELRVEFEMVMEKCVRDVTDLSAGLKVGDCVTFEDVKGSSVWFDSREQWEIVFGRGRIDG